MLCLAVLIKSLYKSLPIAIRVQFKAVKPSGDRVLVKVDKEELKSIGGVLLPSSATKRATAGTIVSVGDVTLVKVWCVRRAWVDSKR